MIKEGLCFFLKLMIIKKEKENFNFKEINKKKNILYLYIVKKEKKKILLKKEKN